MDYYGNVGREGFEKLPRVLQRMLDYTQYPTGSDRDSKTAPSSAKQLVLGNRLVADLRELGLADAAISAEGVVTATIPATPGCEDRPGIGFIAHMDTSPEAADGPVRWQIVSYKGGDVVLNEEGPVVFTTKRFPEIEKYAGQDIVFTDGRTLLGADDKAGVAVIVETAAWFAAHPEVPHAKICFAITPDEEIGRGAENFHVDTFGADYAYTIDGGEVAGFDTETFNAAMARVEVRGLAVHPGSSKGKMINAVRVLMNFLGSLDPEAVPEKTELYEGFIHPIAMGGDVNATWCKLIVRDHDRAKFEAKKQTLVDIAARMNAEFGEERVKVTLKDQYYNLQEYLKDYPKVCELGREAIRRCGMTPIEKPVRGGSDGCRISEMGLPTANYFTGGMNYHGVYECIPVPSLIKCLEVTRTLCTMSADVTGIR